MVAVLLGECVMCERCGNSDCAPVEPFEQCKLYSQMPFQLPLRIEYHRRCPEWHEKSCPYIVDAAGKLVCRMPQHVYHPGQYDAMADLGAKMIVDGVNTGISTISHVRRVQP